MLNRWRSASSMTLTGLQSSTQCLPDPSSWKVGGRRDDDTSTTSQGTRALGRRGRHRRSCRGEDGSASVHRRVGRAARRGRRRAAGRSPRCARSGPFMVRNRSDVGRLQAGGPTQVRPEDLGVAPPAAERQPHTLERRTTTPDDVRGGPSSSLLNPYKCTGTGGTSRDQNDEKPTGATIWDELNGSSRSWTSSRAPSRSSSW